MHDIIAWQAHRREFGNDTGMLKAYHSMVITEVKGKILLELVVTRGVGA
jgi:hypothetical protein